MTMAGPTIPSAAAPHAVSVLRSARLARSAKPFLARGGPRGARCSGCRLVPSHCLCALRPTVATRAGVCLIMADIEALKPSNTGWLIADVVADTFAFGWARTQVEAGLLDLLADPRWLPVLVFPAEFVAPGRQVITTLPRSPQALGAEPAPSDLPAATDTPRLGDHAFAALSSGADSAKRPLFVLLDATWPEARKMFRKSPYLNALPVLSLQPGQVSRYRLRRSKRDDHFCTSEVAGLCMELAGDLLAARTLEAYLDVFTQHYLLAKNQLPVDHNDALHQSLRALADAPLGDVPLV